MMPKLQPHTPDLEALPLVRDPGGEPIREPRLKCSAARVLVVEDESVVALDLENTLTTLGHRVVAIAAKGEHAVELARNSRPDIVLMDIRLAGAIDGVEAARSIQRERDTPVIYLTAHSDDEII